MRYRYFNISKRSGGRRQIEAPNPELKLLQRAMLHSLRALSPSPFSYGVVRGARRCAAVHAGSSVVVRIDIQSFFPSITAKLLDRENLSRHICAKLQIEKATLLDALLLADGNVLRLPQGAPTSPLLADLVLKSFDFIVARTVLLAAFASGLDISKIAYTRYVDDVLISTSETISLVARREFITVAETIVRDALDRLSLKVADDKTRRMYLQQGGVAFCVGFSVAGQELQVSRSMRERARSVCWRIIHGNRISTTDRGVLIYALQGRFRIPQRLLRMLEGTSLESKVVEWLKRAISRSKVAGRDPEGGIVRTLERSVANRLRLKKGTIFRLLRDIALLSHIGSAKVATDGAVSLMSIGEAAVGSVEPSHRDVIAAFVKGLERKAPRAGDAYLA